MHSGIFASIQSILGCLEKARNDDGDVTHPCPMAVVVDETRHHVTSIRNLTGAEMAKLMKSGTRVVRGADWKWSDQVILFLIYLFYCEPCTRLRTDSSNVSVVLSELMGKLTFLIYSFFITSFFYKLINSFNLFFCSWFL